MDDPQLQAYVSAAAKLKATICPSSRLPASVLLQIFMELVLLHNINVGPHVRSPDMNEYPHKWLAVTHVCREWRCVALDCSALWSRIIWCGIPARVDAFLERSGNRLLSLEASKDNEFSHPDLTTWRYGSKLAISNAFLANYSHRIYSIDALSLEPHHGPQPELSLPILTKIHVCQQLSLTPLHSGSANLPKLETLVLCNVSLEVFKSLVRRSITCLHICGDIDSGTRRSLTLPSWIRVLRELPCLKELLLHKANGVLFSSDTLQQELQPTRQRAEMCHLTKVALLVTDSGQVKSCAFLLAHLACPANAVVIIQATNTRQQTLKIDDLVFVLSCVGSRSMLSPPTKASPSRPLVIDTRPSHVGMERSPSGTANFGINIALTMQSNHKEVNTLCLTLPISVSLDTYCDFLLLRHLLSLSSLSNLTFLFVGRLHINAAQWIQVAHLCPLLQRLVLSVEVGGSLASLVEAMEQSMLIEENQTLFPRLSLLGYEFSDTWGKPLTVNRPLNNDTGEVEVKAPEVEKLSKVLAQRSARGLGNVEVRVGIR